MGGTPVPPSSWTGPSPRLRPRARGAASVSRSSPTRCRRAPASPSRRCRSLLAALHERARARRSSCSCPRTPTPATRPRRPRWFLGDERVALSRAAASAGSSGLEPPPHLVGERARALDVLARGGLVCASARALAEPMPPPAARPAPLELARRATSRASTALAEALALAGYERVERVEERGQFAVRGGLVDVFPTTGREPLRIELFGDEIEPIRAFSPFTQRALRAGRRGDDLPGRRAAARPRRADAGPDEDEAPPRSPDDLVPPLDRVARPRLAARRGARGLARGGLGDELVARRRDRARPAPAGPAVLVRGAAARARRARPRRGRERARRRSCARACASSSPSRTAARRCARRTCCAGSRRAMLEPGDDAAGRAGAPVRRLARAARLRLARARPRAAARHAGLPPPRAARAPRSAAARCRPSPTCAPATTSSTRTTASASCSASRRRRSPASRATTSCSRFRGDDRVYVPHEQIGKVSRYIGADAKAPALSKLGGKAWQPQDARARVTCASWPASCSQLYAQRQTRAGRRLRPRRTSGSSGSRRSSRTARRRTRRTAIEAVKEDLEAPRPMDRLVCGDVGFGKTEVALRAAFAVAVERQAGADARADDDPRRSSTGTRSASASATSRCASRWSRASARRPR